MPFKALIYFLLSMIKESSQNALERYFWKTGEVIRMTRQAFSESRQKIRWEALRELFEAAVTWRYAEEIQRGEGYRLLAIDGSKINLPNDPELREYFGTVGTGNSSPCAQGSLLYDIENDVIVDARIEPMATDERTLAAEHIKKLAGMTSFGKELILFDRGYPSIELIELLMKKRIAFVMRVREKFDLGIDGLGLGELMRRCWRKVGRGPVRVRVLKFRLPGGEIETRPIIGIFCIKRTKDPVQKIHEVHQAPRGLYVSGKAIRRRSGVKCAGANTKDAIPSKSRRSYR
ncbi:MAG: transposase [Treponema sp.]|jgi:hypothetical protein|nr:transposase [Treponema sp.]